MIRAQAIADHEKTTGHNGFRGTTDETGRVVCTQCPWQYPPAPEPVTDAEVEAAIAELPGAQADRIEALARGHQRLIEETHQHDSACDDGTLYCPTRDYEANPIDDETSDPGPEPDDGAPEVPPLTLRDRIHNALDELVIKSGGWDEIDPEDIVHDIHAVVGAGADWAPVDEAVELTPAQALAYLLNLPEWARIERLGRLLEEARKSHVCFVMDHEGAVQMRQALLIREQRHLDALRQIARLASPVHEPGTHSPHQTYAGGVLDQIGQISAAALVRQP